MASKQDLVTWVREALAASGGGATVVETARHIWREHGAELRRSGDLLFTWQYDMRLAATELVKRGLIRKERRGPNPGYWVLTRTAR